ncbi:Glycerol:H+ symporter [Tribonema minus]|uniref:Glycerol:H+ symporter n=1 Tax=Tribonema minus TaxID=303371 RepID=A0A835ZAP5_9STRA|nr:Glycerol:H+ symporter [Tribonema minus]
MKQGFDKPAYRSIWYRGLLALLLCYLVAIVYTGATSSAARWRQACYRSPSCYRYLWHLWPPGSWMLDTADNQWRDFRARLPLLSLVIAIHALVSRAIRGSAGGGGGSGEAALARRRTRANLALSAAYLCVLHGAHAVFPVVLALGGYALGARLAGTRACLPATWAYAAALLWVKESAHARLSYRRLFGPLLGVADVFGGAYAWRLALPLLLLRVVSFNADLHWSRTGGGTRSGGGGSGGRGAAKGGAGLSTVSAAAAAAAPAAARARLRQRDQDHYSVGAFLAYAFYAPLYVAGPIMTFDAFAARLGAPAAPRPGALRAYALRLAVALALLEAVLRVAPTFALAKSGAFGGLGAGDLALLGWATLNNMWLKFLVIWRVSRLWALLDGVDPPENMEGCIAGAPSVAAFWARWHVSFHRWLVRYVYAPLGGRARRALAAPAVFALVALWHDARPALAAWGALNAVFVLGEAVIAKRYACWRSGGGAVADGPWDRVIRGVGGAAALLLLAVANLVGYAVGLGGGAGALAAAARGGGGARAARAAALSALMTFACTQWSMVITDVRERYSR